MSGVSRDQPPIPYGKAEKGDDTEWTIRGRRSIKVPVVMLGKAYEFSKATPTTLRTLVTNVWNKTFGVEISYTESYKEAGKKKERISTVRVSYGEIARFLGKSVFALRVEVWRKNNIQELVRQEMAKSESTGIQSLGPVQLRHYIESLMETDDDAFSKTAAFLNSLDGANMTTKPQELTVQLLKYLPIKAHQTIAKTAYAHATSSLYAADLFVKGLDAPELAQHIKTLAAGDSIRLSKTVKFLNGLRPSGMRAAPEAVAEELMKILPEDKRTILAQELSKAIQAKNRGQKSGRKGTPPSPNPYSLFFLKSYITAAVSTCESSISQKDMEHVVKISTAMLPIIRYTPRLARQFSDLMTLEQLEKQLDKKNLIKLARIILNQECAPSVNDKSLFRLTNLNNLIVKGMWISEFSLIEEDTKAQELTATEPKKILDDFLTHATHISKSKIPDSVQTFSTFYFALQRRKIPDSKAKAQVFNAFMLYVSEGVLKKLGHSTQQTSNIGMILCKYQLNEQKANAKKMKLIEQLKTENEGSTHHQKITREIAEYEAAAELWKTHKTAIGKFIQTLITPLPPATEKPKQEIPVLT